MLYTESDPGSSVSEGSSIPYDSKHPGGNFAGDPGSSWSDYSYDGDFDQIETSGPQKNAKRKYLATSASLKTDMKRKENSQTNRCISCKVSI